MSAKPWERPITLAETLTPNAVKILRNELTNDITDDDWESLLLYWERMEIVDRICAGINETFNQ